MKKNLTLVSLVLGVMLLVSVSGVVSADSIFSDNFYSYSSDSDMQNAGWTSNDWNYVEVTSVHSVSTPNSVKIWNDSKLYTETLSTEGYENTKLTYSVKTDVPHTDKLEVYLSVDGGSSWVLIDSVSASTGSSFIEKTVDLKPYSADDKSQIQIEFFYDDGNYGKAYIDDLSITGDKIPCSVTVIQPSNPWYSGTIPIEWTFSQECLSDDWDLAYKEGSCDPSGTDWKSFSDTVDSPQTLDSVAENLNENSQYCIKVEGDNHGDEVNFSSLFKVDNTAPEITALDVTCDEWSPTLLSATATDTDGSGVDTSTWEWTIDGVTYSEDSVSYDCEDGPATINAQVSVSDKVGNPATKAVVITVNNVAPTVNDINTDGPLVEGDSVTLSADVSDPSSDGDTPMTYSWDLSYDETFAEDSALENPTLSCSQDGDIEVAVIVTDEDNAESDVYSKTITCADVLPVITVEDFTCDEGETITLTASATDVPADLPLSYAWNLDGDSSYEEEGQSVSYTCGNGDDTAIVSVQVTDNWEVSTNADVTITISNVPPVANANGPYNAVVNEAFCLLGTATDNFDDPSTFTYEWDLDYDGSTFNVDKTGSNPCDVIYSSNGEKDIALRVKDDFDYSDVVTTKVNVYDYSIHLDEGWNLISIPLLPEDTSIDFVFGSIYDQIADEGSDVATVLQYDSVEDKWYKARKKLSGTQGFTGIDSRELTDIVPGYGYWIKMAEETTLYLNEKEFDQQQKPSPSVQVASSSWNLVGKYELSPNPIDTALAFESLENQVFENSLTGYNTVTDSLEYRNTVGLETGQGYWVYTKNFVDNEETWDYTPITYINY